MKKLDKAIEMIDQQLLDKAAQEKKMKPLLDKQLKVIRQLDGKISWFEDKIKGVEVQKKIELRKMSDLMELAETSSHKLSNGYSVKPDNKCKVTITDIGKFMRWLKENKQPSEVMEFLEEAMGVVKIKKFCQKEMNLQRLNGEILPTIDGVDLGDVTYTLLKTEEKK